MFVSPSAVIRIPGDEIVGFVTRGRGITIHRTDCVNVLEYVRDRPYTSDRGRMADSRDVKAVEKYTAEIQVYANNRTGLAGGCFKDLYRTQD